MNVREELYLSGGGLVVAHVYGRRSSRRVAVLDNARRAKAALRCCFRAGMTPRQAARVLDIPLPTVVRLGLAIMRDKSWIKSNSGVAKVGNDP